jgi:hypothetical protein
MAQDVGVQGSKNLVPMQPTQSVAWLRTNALPNEGRMPQIGTDQHRWRKIDGGLDRLDQELPPRLGALANR